jgi:hypothetical protein
VVIHAEGFFLDLFPLAMRVVAHRARRGRPAFTLIMTLKNAALFAFIGMAILTAFLAVDFIDVILAVARGLVPAMKLLTSFVDLLASAGLTVFLYVFQSAQR